MRNGRIILDHVVASVVAASCWISADAQGAKATLPVQVLGSHVGEQAWMQIDNMLEGIRGG